MRRLDRLVTSLHSAHCVWKGRLHAAAQELLPQADLNNTSKRKFRKQVSDHLGWGRKGLDPFAEQVNELLKEAVAQQLPPPETAEGSVATIIKDLGDAVDVAKNVYLLTIARTLPNAEEGGELRDTSTFSHEDVATWVRDVGVTFSTLRLVYVDFAPRLCAAHMRDIHARTCGPMPTSDTLFNSDLLGTTSGIQ